MDLTTVGKASHQITSADRSLLMRQDKWSGNIKTLSKNIRIYEIRIVRQAGAELGQAQPQLGLRLANVGI